MTSFLTIVQHYLRGEFGLEYDDYAGLLPPELYKNEASGWERTTVASPDRITAAAALDPNSQNKARPPPMKRPTATTPLLTDSLRTVEFHAYHERSHLPFPLVYVNTVISPATDY
jgi:putative membrane protein